MSSPEVVRKFFLLMGFSLVVLILPMAGLAFWGIPWSSLVSFPPYIAPVNVAPFSLPVFCLYLSVAAGVVGIGIWLGRAKVDREVNVTRSNGRFPWWGWVALVLNLVWWILAWSRFSWFVSLQKHTFTPFWITYIIVVNGLLQKTKGWCPLLNRPVFLLILFPVSGLFWWYFEYLNQFVHNWYYVGVDFGPFAYVFYASIAFSTVLPAVYSTYELLLQTDWLQNRFHGLWSLRIIKRRAALVLGMMSCCVGLIFIGKYPNELFPLLWVAPLILGFCLLEFSGETTHVSPIFKGDWRPVVASALAALVCGVFWEMWNSKSLAMWHYSIPYVHRFPLFEMPILGYMGYLPFGIECMLVAGVVESLLSGEKWEDKS